jgi:SAM-dependent methyltransferase
MKDLVRELFRREVRNEGGIWIDAPAPAGADAAQTKAAFGDKWGSLEQDAEDREGWKAFQYDWYLKCYGFGSEGELAEFLHSRKIILDAGCGPGYKAAWFARLAPDTLVVAMDITEAAQLAGARYRNLPNLVAVQGDIASTPFEDGAFDFISCDQVLHHTVSPPATLAELARILASDGTLNTYVYAKKALPRELLDEHLRSYSKELGTEDLWALAGQLTELGRTLSELEIEIDVPDMPALGIKGGRQNLQRFLYWNFIKCFWNAEHGFEASKMINFDWYAPSLAFRYSQEEFVSLLAAAGFKADFLHSEEACHSGRFVR